MALLEWSDALSLDLPLMDDTHHEFVELLALVEAVMSREDLKYCPHGRPICITLSKKQLERQFKRA